VKAWCGGDKINEYYETTIRRWILFKTTIGRYIGPQHEPVQLNIRKYLFEEINNNNNIGTMETEDN